MNSAITPAIRALLDQMTVEEKVQLTLGNGFWRTYGVERLGVLPITVNDGPSGLRRPVDIEQIGIIQSIPATCFPAAGTLASSWDIKLVEEVGQALALECLAADVQILLGPGINIKRTPLGGRCFEYYSEDPVLSGEMGCAFVQGVQSKGVGTSLKHYACNNQEYDRMTISSEVDQRTLRELYLAVFERVVRRTQPWTVMAAYNKVNGTFASEHPELLQQILKTEWAYSGAVVSDWGAVNEKVDALKAGLDLEMPGRPGNHQEQIVQLVREGALAESVIDEAAARILALLVRGQENRRPGATFDALHHHALARRAAAESVVLLKNQDGLLPLHPEKLHSVAVLGRFARLPRYQGAGSARVNPLQLDNALAELRLLLPETVQLVHADGYGEDSYPDEGLMQAAVEVARSADLAIIFAGLTDTDESEGVDRQDIHMPESHNRLIAEVSRVQPATIVVLCNGSTVTMPWLAEVEAVLEAGLGGQASGGAVADVLLGRVNPSGRLAETFARRLEDTPAYLHYPGEADRVLYGEGLFVGYRYYERKKIEPLFPFGYGLSYTSFEHTNLRVSQSTLTDEETLEVSVTVRNTGAYAGKEVVQLYLRDVEASVARPEKELKAFATLALEPGETRDVQLLLQPRDFAFYDSELQRWRVETGEFQLLIGKSSREITLSESVTVNARSFRPVFSKWQSIRRFLAHPKATEVLMNLYATSEVGTEGGEAMDLQMILNVPLIKLVTFGVLSNEQVDALVTQVNQAVQE